MTRIKSFTQFITEEISGTELVGPIGPAFGETRLQNKTVNTQHTNVILCDLDNRFYTVDEYNNSYQEYLSKGGKPLPDGFNVENLTKIVVFLTGK